MTVAPTLTTARLVLRPPRFSDAAPFFSFLGDATAMRFTHCHRSLRECQKRLAGFEWQRRRTGIAPWAVLTRDEGRLIGWAGLYQDPFEPGWGVELGYAFHPHAWGRGYATEAALACAGHADAVLAIAELSAFAHSDNTASRRVLERAGFSEVRYVADKHRLLLRRLRGRASS